MIFIDAVEIDEGLASHLVGSDPLLRDQFISFCFSKFAITATVLERDEPEPFVAAIISHGSCKCSDDLGHNRIKDDLAELTFS